MDVKQRVMRALMGVGAIRIAAIPFGLGISVVLARYLGPEQFGQYAFIVSLVPLLAIPVAGGMQNLITREVAGYDHAKQWGCFRGAVRAAYLWVIFYSFLLFVIYLMLKYVFEIFPSMGKWSYFSYALLMVPLVGLNSVRKGVIKGLGYPVASELPEVLIKPGIVLLVLLLMVFYASLEVGSVLLIQILSSLVVLLIAVWIMLNVTKGRVVKQAPRYLIRVWGGALAPFLLLSLIGVFNTQVGIVALGIFSDDEQVAALRVAERGANFIAMPLAIVNLIISPYIVAAYKKNDKVQLQQLSRQCARFAFFTALPVGIILIFWGDLFIDMLFGDEYVGLGYWPLVILAAGQLFNVFFGSVGYLLVMTGNERKSLAAQLIAVSVSVMLCVVLIPAFGAVGAALAVTSSVIIWNCILGYMVFSNIGIRPTAL